MSLYIAYTDSLDKRQTGNIFFCNDKGCFLRANKEETQILNATKLDYRTIKNIVSYAEENKIDTLEIVLKDKYETEYFATFLNEIASLLVDKDLSVGLLTLNRDFIKNNEGVIKNLGLYPFFPRFPRARKESNKIHYSYSKRAPSSNRFDSRIIEDNKFYALYEPAPKSAPKRKTANPERIILDESFHDKLFRLLIESGKENSEVYNRGGITKQVFSKALSNKNGVPSKSTIICLIIGMELPYKDAVELLKSAGYVLSKSMLFDAIVDKYLKKGVYDLFIINDDLYEHQCPLLGWKPRNS